MQFLLLYMKNDSLQYMPTSRFLYGFQYSKFESVILIISEIWLIQIAKKRLL